MESTSHSHYLSAYLEERLPALGLDYETYGSYVIGIVDADSTDNDEEASHDWDDILELLAASSESHSDDAAVWLTFQQDILQRRADHRIQESADRESVAQQKALHEKERLAKEIELAQLTPEVKKVKPQLTDAQKAIVAKYAYDDSIIYDKDGNLVETKDLDQKVVSNKDVAAQVAAERKQELRNAAGPSKKDAQKETKQAKLDKAKLKEDRRKRAVKGERKS
jgi:hypothetical protein